MPTIMYLFGLRFYLDFILPFLATTEGVYSLCSSGLTKTFYSEEHLPIHVHVQNGDGKAKINVETLEVIENKGIKPTDLKKAVDAVRSYQTDIKKAWYEHFDEE